MPRRYSCRDLPARAARAASSSRTSSGTSLTVIATPIAVRLAAVLLKYSTVRSFQTDRQAAALASAVSDTTAIPPEVAKLHGIALAGVVQIIISEAAPA